MISGYHWLPLDNLPLHNSKYPIVAPHTCDNEGDASTNQGNTGAGWCLLGLPINGSVPPFAFALKGL
jgi:hypothetical protein